MMNLLFGFKRDDEKDFVRKACENLFNVGWLGDDEVEVDCEVRYSWPCFFFFLVES